MNKSLNNQFLRGAFALSLMALLSAGQSLFPGGPSLFPAPPTTPIDLKQLQGYWEGEGAGGKCSITITNNTLRYYVGANWHEATFTLPTSTNHQQLHATITDSLPPSKSNIGTVVHAIIKLEDGTLTLGTFYDPADPPKTFDTVQDKYVVKKAQPKKENPNPPKTCEPEKPSNPSLFPTNPFPPG